MAKLPLKTIFPKEQIISVVDGAPCYIGWSTVVAEPKHKHHTILMAPTKAELRKSCEQFGTNVIDEAMFYRIVFVKADDATLDDAL